MTAKQGFPKAKAAALRALEIDPELAEAHTALAMVFWLYDWDWAAADREFRRAIELNPRYATAHHWFALHLAEIGNFEEALSSIKRALEITPLSLPVNADLGRVLFYARRYDESLAQYRKTIEMNPTYGAFYGELGDLYEQLGMVEPWIAAKGYSEIQSLYGVLREHDFKAYYREYLNEIEKGQLTKLDYYYRAGAHAALGEKDQAFNCLNQAYEERNHQITQIKVNPMFDPLRSDPRFQDLLRRLNLTPDRRTSLASRIHQLQHIDNGIVTSCNAYKEFLKQ